LNASKVVKAGGSLVYSTCSLERDEGEDIARRFLSERAEYSLEQPKVARRFVTDDGFARTWPQRDGMDGFFIAAFRKGL
jgi:16S rRNA (cytosine967-C5)-methyltransferase